MAQPRLAPRAGEEGGDPALHLNSGRVNSVPAVASRGGPGGAAGQHVTHNSKHKGDVVVQLFYKKRMKNNVFSLDIDYTTTGHLQHYSILMSSETV